MEDEIRKLKIEVEEQHELALKNMEKKKQQMFNAMEGEFHKLKENVEEQLGDMRQQIHKVRVESSQQRKMDIQKYEEDSALNKTLIQKKR